MDGNCGCSAVEGFRIPGLVMSIVGVDETEERTCTRRCSCATSKGVTRTDGVVTSLSQVESDSRFYEISGTLEAVNSTWSSAGESLPTSVQDVLTGGPGASIESHHASAVKSDEVLARMRSGFGGRAGELGARTSEIDRISANSGDSANEEYASHRMAAHEWLTCIDGGCIPLPAIQASTWIIPGHPTYSWTITLTPNWGYGVLRKKKKCTVDIWCGDVPYTPACHCWIVVKPCDGEAKRYDLWQENDSDRGTYVEGTKHILKNRYGSSSDGLVRWIAGQDKWRECHKEEDCPDEDFVGPPDPNNVLCCQKLNDEEMRKYADKDKYGWWSPSSSEGVLIAMGALIGPNSNTFVKKAAALCDKDGETWCPLPGCAHGGRRFEHREFDFYGKITPYGEYNEWLQTEGHWDRGYQGF